MPINREAAVEDQWNIGLSEPHGAMRLPSRVVGSLTYFPNEKDCGILSDCNLSPVLFTGHAAYPKQEEWLTYYTARDNALDLLWLSKYAFTQRSCSCSHYRPSYLLSLSTER